MRIFNFNILAIKCTGLIVYHAIFQKLSLNFELPRLGNKLGAIKILVLFGEVLRISILTDSLGQFWVQILSEKWFMDIKTFLPPPKLISEPF
jgi:hypothetical protein